MARARNIKPGFYKNEDLAECSIWSRFIFPGLWMLADREGRLEDRPKRIKAELLPFDGPDVDKLLNELRDQGFIIRYKNENGNFIEIAKFTEHQSPHYSEKPSVIKPPKLPENLESIHRITPRNIVSSSHQNSRSPLGNSPPETELMGGPQPPDSLNPDSLNPDSLNPDSLNVGKKASRKRATPPQTPLPDGFSISERVLQWAEKKGFSDIDVHFENFVGKAKAKGYTYADWDEAFMTAVRDDWAKLRSGKGADNAAAFAEAERLIFSSQERDITDESDRV